MSIQSLVTYQQALAAGDTFWRLQISNWGNRETGADANSIQYTGAVDGAQYVTIGPESTADEVIVGYSAPSTFNRAFTIPNPGFQNQISMTVGITRPGVMLPGPLTIRTAMSTQFCDSYFRDGNPIVQNFGGLEPLFEAPSLQLLVYPYVPTMPALPKRADLYRHAQTSADADVGDETLIAIWPVMGRSCKALYFRATNDLVATIRVGAISYFTQTVVGNPSPRAVEDTVATADINATTGVQESIITGRPMQWVAVYYTRTSGTGFINTNLIAQDC
jgi:hypothetical protein